MICAKSIKKTSLWITQKDDSTRVTTFNS